MTAPALPGAAPDPAPGRNDPARLPPEVERAIDAAVNAAHDAGNAYGSDYWSSSEREFARITSENATAALRAAIMDAMRAASVASGAASPAAGAIARALGGDGEPVACPECAARKPDDGDWWARHVLKAKSLAALKSIAEGWPMSRPAATGDTVGAAARALVKAAIDARAALEEPCKGDSPEAAEEDKS